MWPPTSPTTTACAAPLPASWTKAGPASGRPASPCLDRRWGESESGQVAWSTPMVGRSGDRARLAEVLGARSVDRTAVVVGDAGIGKSRLLLEVAEQLTGQGAVVLQGGCLPMSESVPLLPLVEALRRVGRGDGGRLLRGGLEARAGHGGAE